MRRSGALTAGVLRRLRLGAGGRRGIDLLYNPKHIGELLSLVTSHSFRHLHWRRLLRRLLRSLAASWRLLMSVASLLLAPSPMEKHCPSLFLSLPELAV